MSKRDHVVATLDAYLAQGYEVKQLGGAAGDDWRELRIILQRPIPADHTHSQVIGGTAQ